MTPPKTVETIAAACKRYGPGRLPGADRTDIGAGYAGATAALGLAVAYALGMATLHALGGPVWFGHAFWAISALLAVPIVVATAFVAGTVVWRVLPDPDTVLAFGAVAGLLATIATYALSLAAVFVLFVVGQSLGVFGTGTEPLLLEAGVLTATVGVVAIGLTGWLALPLGCLSGVIYERARVVSEVP